jgi:hypothetical protein
MDNDKGVSDVLIMSDKAHFYFCGYGNKQNSMQNVKGADDCVQHSESLAFWALSIIWNSK